ncbi:MAG: leucyl aminopeptidase family protein, partial [Xanthomonadales bacterium]|nr:leucyl aminopeptidase family protein [Xanthomonadales bacterium]
MNDFYVTEQADSQAIPLIPLRQDEFESWKASASAAQRRWVEASGFNAAASQFCTLPGPDGSLQSGLFGLAEQGWLYQLAPLVASLPCQTYRLQCDWTREQRLQASLGWGLASYRFDRYKANDTPRAALQLAADIDADVRSFCEAQFLVRNLVNTPTEHLGPAQLADAATREADLFEAASASITGPDLLTHNFPAIHAVGRASASQPRLVELDWGEEDLPLLTLVGKGVCFDSGGLDMKSSSGMALMKKDMGGGAHALALARLVMQHRLPVRLKLLIPAVENSVSGNAYRPGDVIATRKGLTVEIGNTDAEGRVVLADALAYACEQQ